MKVRHYLISMLKYLAWIFIFIFLFGCTNSRRVNILDCFTQFEEISPDETYEDVFSNFPYSFVISDSLLIGISSEFGSCQMETFDLLTCVKSAYLKHGRGPYESNHVDAIFLDNDTIGVSVYPDATYLYTMAIVDSLKTLKPIQRIDMEGITHMGEIISFRRNINDSENSTMYCTSSRNDTTAIFWGNFPDEDKISYPTYDESKHTAYQGDLYISPNGTKALFVFYYAIGFDLLDLKNKTVHHHLYRSPQIRIYHIDELKANLIRGRKNWQRGFIEGSSTDEFIFLLYKQDGQTFVLKYDWDANPLSAFSITDDVRNLYVSTDGKTIYTIYNDNNSCNLRVYHIG